jgi:hypothetical protein
MLNDIATRLREKGITKQSNPAEFETQRLARAEEIISSFATSIRKSVKNSTFFIFNPKSATDKVYQYKFNDITTDEGPKVEVKIVPDKTEDSVKMIEIKAVEDFIGNMVKDFLPYYHQYQFFEYGSKFMQDYHVELVTKSLSQDSLKIALNGIEKEVQTF